MLHAICYMIVKYSFSTHVVFNMVRSSAAEQLSGWSRKCLVGHFSLILPIKSLCLIVQIVGSSPTGPSKNIKKESSEWILFCI